MCLSVSLSTRRLTDKPVSHEAFLLTHSCDSWLCGRKAIFGSGNLEFAAPVIHMQGSWVAVHSSQGLQPAALQLRTRRNYLDVFAQRNSDSPIICFVLFQSRWKNNTSLTVALCATCSTSYQ